MKPTAVRAKEVARLLADGVRRHREGRLDAAAASYRRVLALEPKQPDALHLAGLVAHQQGDHARALTLIDAAIAAADGPAPFHSSRGVVLLARDQPAAAEAAFRAALARDPLFPEALNNLGNALQRQDRLDEAIDAYERATDVRPDYAEAWNNRGRALHLAGRPADAAESCGRALSIRPEWPKALRWRADALAALGRRDDAEALYRRALALDAADAETHAALAALLERAGRLDEGLAAAEAALGLHPGQVRAAVVAARCERRLARAEQALARLEALDLDIADAETAAWALFERAQILDALGDPRRAYDTYVASNARMSATPAARRADRDWFPRAIDRLAARFTPDWLATWTAPAAGERPAPIFLIGFPRSGTTLLDQILDAHPALRTMEEKDPLDVVRRAVDALPGGYPDALARLDADAQRRLRRIYFDAMARHLGPADGRTPVDKMPLNIVDAGLIHRLFPDARVLLALRHPCDVVLSGFMQAMQPNDAMVHFDSIDGLARFYARVMGLWRRYARVLPLTVLDVRYEDLVADLPAEAKRILDFLGLPWDDAVLGYAEHARTRSISTPSYHQVVQPIYRRSVGRWHRYAFAFDSALPILQPFADAWGYGERDDADDSAPPL